MLTLEYYNETSFTVSERFFDEILETINLEYQEVLPKKVRGKKHFMITLTLVNDAIIRKINKQHRGIDKPTDVISLSYLDDEEFPGNDMIGEIFISVETAKKQAKEMIHDEAAEIKFLFLHGVLHILGYEHQTEKDFQIMMDLTNEIMAK